VHEASRGHADGASATVGLGVPPGAGRPANRHRSRTRLFRFRRSGVIGPRICAGQVASQVMQESASVSLTATVRVRVPGGAPPTPAQARVPPGSHALPRKLDGRSTPRLSAVNTHASASPAGPRCSASSSTTDRGSVTMRRPAQAAGMAPLRPHYLRHAAVSTVPRVPGQGRPTGQATGRQHPDRGQRELRRQPHRRPRATAHEAGIGRARFRVAVSGRREQEPSFFTVIVWRDQAEHAAESLSKSSRVVSWVGSSSGAGPLRMAAPAPSWRSWPRSWGRACDGRRRPRPGRRGARASSQ
jgi:Single-strand binding protein family